MEKSVKDVKAVKTAKEITANQFYKLGGFKNPNIERKSKGKNGGWVYFIYED